MKKKLIGLVFSSGESLFTTSLVVADGCGLKHEAVIKLARKYKPDFEELGTFRFQIQKSGGRETEYAVLNEDQATYLITLFRNTEIVRRFKLELVKAFRRAINEITRLREQRLSIDWQEARANGKCVRSVLTDAVKCLERIADRQGGEKGKPENRHYYPSVTKRIYKELFGDGSLKDIRDKLDALQLQFLSIVEQSCADEIQRLAELEVDYHLIYQECVKRIKATVNGLSASRLASPNQAVRLAWDRPQ